MSEETTQDVWRALVNGDGDIVDRYGDGVRFGDDGELEWKPGPGTSGGWRKADSSGDIEFPLRRAPLAPATFTDALRHILAGEMVKAGVDGAPFSLIDADGEGQLLRDSSHLDSVELTRDMLTRTDWLVCINRRWVSAATEAP